VRCLPDYHGGSIVNLMASIVRAFGGDEPLYAALRALPEHDLTTRNVVLLVIDGLGYDYLTQSGARTLNAMLEARITSVFPSTTATAVTTFLTGTAPQQHGLTGWHMYFREIGSVAAVLPYRARHGGTPLAVSVQDLLAHEPVFDRLNCASHVVSPQEIAYSAFNTAHLGTARLWPYASLDAMLESIRNAVGSGPARQYVYAYWPELDRLAHMHGIGSDATDAHLAALDTAFERLLHELAGTDTTVIVTADHGFVNACPDAEIMLAAHPALERTLLVPLCGEPRATYCYVIADHREAFLAYVAAQLAPHAEALESRQLIESGWFGLGDAHPRLSDRVGDYTLLSTGAATVRDRIPGEKHQATIGVHGGTSHEEMHVPLVVARV
jgi:hypothetical protein